MGNLKHLQNDQITREFSVTWAEKARMGLPAVHRPGRQESKERCTSRSTLPSPPGTEVLGEGRPQRNGAPIMLQIIPLDVWDVISSFLGFRELESLSSTCFLLWVQLHTRDSIWKRQLQYLRCDMVNSRRDGGPLSTELIVMPSFSHYELMKLVHKLYVMDTRREWHFRDREKNGRTEGVFTRPLSFFNVGDNNRDCSSSEEIYEQNNGEFIPLSRIRILRPVLLGYSGSAFATDGGESFGSNDTSAIHAPGEYLALCDNINHNDFTGSRVGVEDLTDQHDELFLFALQQTLGRAKRRPPPGNSGTDTCRSQHLMLRHFDGVLLDICRYEAEQILQSVLHMPGLLDNFVSYSIPGQKRSSDAGVSTSFSGTRYFIAPELCRRGRVGLIVVDPLRVLVVVGKERTTRDSTQWDEVHTAAAEGRAVPGSGMNPQQSRRM